MQIVNHFLRMILNPIKMAVEIQTEILGQTIRIDQNEQIIDVVDLIMKALYNLIKQIHK